jgi:hypothetical protein
MRLNQNPKVPSDPLSRRRHIQTAGSAPVPTAAGRLHLRGIGTTPPRLPSAQQHHLPSNLPTQRPSSWTPTSRPRRPPPASVGARARGGGRPSHGPPRVHLAAGGTLAPGLPAGAEDDVAHLLPRRQAVPRGPPPAAPGRRRSSTAKARPSRLLLVRRYREPDLQLLLSLRRLSTRRVSTTMAQPLP